MTTSADVRARLVTTLRRDLVGPLPDETDIATERLPERPSRWYLTGFIAPIEDAAPDEAAWDAEGDIEPEPPADPVMPGRAEDDTEADNGSAARRLMPNSLGLTVLLRPEITEIEAMVSWGDYVTEPPIEEMVLIDDQSRQSPPVEWRRIPREVTIRLQIQDGRSERPIVVPDSAAPQVRGGGLALETHSRVYTVEQPNGSRERVRALTVVLVNRRRQARRRYADVCFAFQARIALYSHSGFVPRCDLSGLAAQDEDRRLADLHYRDVQEYAVGCNTSAGWTLGSDGEVRTTWTDPLPQAEVERVEPNTGIVGVEWDMLTLGDQAATGAASLDAALRDLPAFYEEWIAAQADDIPRIDGDGRRITAQALIGAMRTARDRIAAGIALLRDDAFARRAFQAMNEAVARAAIQRDPSTPRPRWRPFQLAFILLNLSGLADKRHDDREVVDLLFFPTGGGKTEAYLGLAAWTIAHRRLTNSGKLGAGVAVLMRYTLRLLTLDQLARASGVICALELMRGEPAWLEGDKRLLGDWPIEIGLWIGSAASANRLGGRGNNDPATAVKRIDRFRRDGKEAPAPLKVCPWCGTPFDRESFSCKPNASAPRNMEIRCAKVGCPFSGDRALPVLTVDEAIYRRLPAFLIATVDKFAGLPWLAESGAFFGNVNRADEWGFYGAADSPREGTRLFNGASLDPPDLIIQDELHLISGPLGTVAGLYETALDRLSTRVFDHGARIRPKIVASTATVRRARAQIQALFDREQTAIFPPPGPERRDSFFALTVPATEAPARLYVGLAAQGKGPKLVFLRALTTLLAAAMKEREETGEAVDPYMTALCYFNALRELGGARRIVEDEVNARLRSYGAQRRRRDPVDQPFADRAIGEPMELTSRVSTDQVAAAKQRLDQSCDGKGSGVDVALATNMISVGLDITRLGLMLVQGQPKTAAEYIQTTSRVGRRADKPGLVLAVLNVHKPRDRMHYEQFRQFHAGFYRAVEATSVTPWAARALDRALAAVLVAIARHLDPALTHETAVRVLADHPDVRDEVKRVVLARAPADVRVTLEATVDELLANWVRVANEQTANGAAFYYAVGDQRLLHQPLEPALQRLSPEHQRFIAGRSMRDVEFHRTTEIARSRLRHVARCMMAKDVLRLSQIVGTFGPGAMVDLPDRSVLVGGLNQWDMHVRGAFQVIEEPRLTGLLEERLRGTGRIADGKKLTLRTPPIDPGNPRAAFVPGVAATVFPTWFVCDAVIETNTGRRRRMVRWNELNPNGRNKYRDEESKKDTKVSPLRFVCGCENGHLQDISWKWVVHGDRACADPMWLEDSGTSGDPRDSRVVCGCGNTLSLEQLFQPGRLGACRGARPWIGSRDPDGCTQNLRLLTRSATNTYFPQAATVISLPRSNDELSRRTADFLSMLARAETAAEIRVARRMIPALSAALEGYTDEDVFACVQRLTAGGADDAVADPRIAEFEVFSGGQALIGEDRPNALLHAETLGREKWDPNGDPLLEGIEGLVPVHRLREVVCLYGFTRFEAAPTVSDDMLEDVGLAVRGAPLGEAPDWLPAIEQFGEGIFVQFKPEFISRWLARPGTQQRARLLLDGFNAWAARRGRLAPEPRGVPYTLLHSLSHVLMGEIALDCGYPASSLKERVYALPPAAKDGPVRCGLLIYTATAGTQGTLGGLVEVAERFRVVLRSALERLELCSSDPVCSDHDPTTSTDDRALHGAACHGCLLIAETSCEARNLFLDRALLVSTMAETDAAFFIVE